MAGGGVVRRNKKKDSKKGDLKKERAYCRNLAEWVVTVAGGVLLCTVVGVLFYGHALGVLALLPLLPFYIRFDGRRRLEKQAGQLEEQFKDALSCMAAAMQAGMSMEQSVGRAAEELRALYPGKAPILKGLRMISARLEVNETVEQAFFRLGEDTGVVDIQDFAQVLITAKRTGGNLIQVMGHTAACMEMRREVKREILTLVSGKRLEAAMMNLLPAGMLVYLRLGLPELARPLYHNPAGIAIMTVALAVYAASFLWSQRLVRVAV